MYRLWNSAGGGAATLGPSGAGVGGALVPAAPSSSVLALHMPGTEHDRDRQRSIDLLRDRAFRVRESTAEQQAEALRSELIELRVALPACLPALDNAHS